MKRKFNLTDGFIHIALALLALLAIFPFYYVLIVSFADPTQLLKRLLYILPYGFDFSSYAILFMENSMLKAFGVSFFVTLTGAALSMVMTTTAAYALSKKQAPFRSAVLYMILFTMFFSGQLIPYYVLIKTLGMRNSLTVMIIPAALNTFYLIILKNYFLTVPQSLEESAKIDGASEIKIFWKIVLPLSTPVIATIAFLGVLGRWNEWYSAMLFITKRELIPLQYFLQQIIMSMEFLTRNPLAKEMLKGQAIPGETARMAMVVVTAGPLVLVFPFFQKYFVKGMTMGSLKG
jgi:putative aldouronate transport system permease protein